MKTTITLNLTSEIFFCNFTRVDETEVFVQKKPWCVLFVEVLFLFEGILKSWSSNRNWWINLLVTQITTLNSQYLRRTPKRNAKNARYGFLRLLFPAQLEFAEASPHYVGSCQGLQNRHLGGLGLVVTSCVGDALRVVSLHLFFGLVLQLPLSSDYVANANVDLLNLF